VSASVFRFCGGCSAFDHPPYGEGGKRDDWTIAADGSWLCPDCRKSALLRLRPRGDSSSSRQQLG